jgi:hypothetical protein
MATDQRQTTPQHGDGGAYGSDEIEQAQRLSPWAVAGIIVAFVVGPLGLLVNAYALHRIGQTGQRGQALAAAGLGVSIIMTIFSLVFAGSLSFVSQINY